MAVKLAVVIGTPSNSAKVLAQSLGVKRVRPGRVPSIRRKRLFINWGNSHIDGNHKKVLNWPEKVRIAADKIAAFTMLEGTQVPFVPFTDDREVAQQWSNDGHKVLARSTANGSGGVGISVIERGAEVPSSLFYTRYIKKSAEYRVHVVAGKVIFTQQKRRRSGIEQTREQSLIRNHDNGWVFAENNVTFSSPEVESRIKQVAVDATRELGLDFAAIDLIVERETDDVYFLEANTRPGLQSTRLIGAYTSAFNEIAANEG
jgi:glutathione synthase/RimK-type ligase-like ATP-grasp enzyme